MRSLGVILVLIFSFTLIVNKEVYIGFMLLLFTFITVIKYAASSVYGDFSRTAEEIKSYVKLQEKKPSFDYLSYPEQKVVIEERRKQDVIDRKRKSAENKAQAKRTKRIYRRTASTNPSLDVWDDYLIQEQTCNNSMPFEETYINPSTGMIMIGGIGGIDAGGNFWGQSDYFDDSFSDSFSSIDDTSSSLNDSSDFFSTGMDDS
jgi:hypothetical protein